MNDFSGSPHEAPPHEDDPQPPPQLWTLQKDGSLQVLKAAAELDSQQYYTTSCTLAHHAFLGLTKRLRMR